jgi:hypothetical protein
MDLHRQSIIHSQAITDFKRILKILTDRYGVWISNDATKNLFDHGEFEKLDFYDFRLRFEGIGAPRNQLLVDKLFQEEKFQEGISNTYLAMVSLIGDRSKDYYFQKELHTDFAFNGIYELKMVKRWWQCKVADSIYYWMNHKANWIRYDSLREFHPEIKAAAVRINPKYDTYKVDDQLIEDLSQDVQHHIDELYFKLIQLKTGLRGTALIITNLSTVSLVVGVLIPFSLLPFSQCGFWFNTSVKILLSINLSLFAFFAATLPYLLKKELRWE